MTCFPATLEIVRANYSKPICANIDSIIRGVSREFDISIDDIRSSRRFRHLVEARQMVIYLTLEFTSMTLNEVGKFIGARHHSTIIHARENMRAYIYAKYDNPIKEKYLKLVKSFS